ncbi:M1 family aminopeptidase [Sphingomonas sp.]|uniref:ABC transporter permease/M1 family aminopeptidase n=1 Tax=Sphingomonas sp. TaxID=28214 RepID=UPI001D3F0532|nr:M1 family aminopeptidase [Sphingomonas sp.]MBX9796019.1 aminopeptidase [Sphingomonas sp.]
MFAKIASFELRYQLRNPVFWTVAVLFFLMTFGAATIEQIQIGSGGSSIHRNSPVSIIQTHLILSLFFMFVTTAFVANVIVRDDESGFGPIVRSTRVGKFDYLMGRFTGAFLAAGIAFLVVPLAIWLGSFMPWVDRETLGPNYLAAYAHAYLVMALPDILLTSALFFAVATMTRSVMYSYVGVVVFLVIYLVVVSALRTRPELRETAALFEPFGFGAFGQATRYWTAAEANRMVPPLSTTLLFNRGFGVVLSLVALAIAYARFSFSERGISGRALKRAARREAKLAAVPPQLVATLPALQPDRAGWTQLMARTRFEMALVFRSPAFLVLMLVGLFNAVSALFLGNDLYGTPARPLTFGVIGVLNGAFGIIPVIIAIYYSGELVWRDRERKMHEIIDATALPNWAYMVPKTLAVSGVLIACLVIAMLGGIAVQLIRGQTDLALGEYLAWYVLPSAADMVILAVLAVFVQALSPNKYIGWGIMVIYLVATITLNNLGFEHPLYNFGSTGNIRLSDMNGDDVGGATGWWLRLYWGSFALILGVLAHLLWRRGTQVSFASRARRVPARLAGLPGVLIATGVAAAAATGGFIYYNMNVLNEYRTREDTNKLLAEYERKYLHYEKVKQPSVSTIKLAVDLYPSEKRAEARGSYQLVNTTGAPLSDLHLRVIDPDMKLLSVDLPGARLVHDDKRLRYRIYRFDQPLAPGAGVEMRFATQRWQRGFRAEGDDTRMVRNGSFLNNFEFAPRIGMDRDTLLSDPVTRRRFKLPSQLRMAKLEDLSATQRNYIGNASWVQSDITVTTDAGQTPIAPGRRVADSTANGRRTARFVSKVPILAFFSVQSAAYAERSMPLGGGVTGTVYFDPKHAYNVDRMLNAMKLSLDYYRANFGPYQFDYARVLEFPGYASFAQAFAGTIPYSERIGFIADTRDPDAIDYVTYVTAHELGHQYWAHQLISAEMQGGTMLVETMAQYSALMVMKKLYGEDKIRRFLKYELDNYLRSRGGESVEELPLNRVENQPYIHYRKGSVVLYLLQDRLGEARVNAMLAKLLDRFRFKGAPYARSTDLVEGFKSLARNDAERQLVSDLLERITLYDLKAETATVKKLADGRYETRITVAARKFYADGSGKERETPLADTVDIGLFGARPGIGAFSAKDVVLIDRRPIASGKQEIRVISTKKPAFAGVDAYNKYVDRNSDDNVTAVTG